MNRSDLFGDRYYLLEYQLRIDGNAIGSPATVAIKGDPQEWRRKQTGGAVLLSSTEIDKTTYMMRSMDEGNRLAGSYVG